MPTSISSFPRSKPNYYNHLSGSFEDGWQAVGWSEKQASGGGDAVDGAKEVPKHSHWYSWENEDHLGRRDEKTELCNRGKQNQHEYSHHVKSFYYCDFKYLFFNIPLFKHNQ